MIDEKGLTLLSLVPLDASLSHCSVASLVFEDLEGVTCGRLSNEPNSEIIMKV